MRVGLLSKPEHCRPHVKALKALGLKVDVLGGDPGTKIPARIDILVVRACSISHDAFGVAKAWERDGGTVFYEEGATRCAEVVEEWMSTTVRAALKVLLEWKGWFHWYIPCTLSDAQCKSLGLTSAQFAEALKSLKGVSPGTIRGAIASIAKKKGWKKIHRGDANAGFPGRPIQIWAHPSLEKKETHAPELDVFLSYVVDMRKAAGGQLPTVRDTAPESSAAPAGPEDLSDQKLKTNPPATLTQLASVQSDVDDNTTSLVRLMTDMDNLSNRVGALTSSMELALSIPCASESDLKALRHDFDHLRDKLPAALVELAQRIDSVAGQCAVLESKVGALAAKPAAPALDVDALKKELQADLRKEFAQALDELLKNPALLPRNAAPVAGPLAAIDGIKSSLADMGFRGTLHMVIGDGE
jgi:hypothetical protein